MAKKKTPAPAPAPAATPAPAQGKVNVKTLLRRNPDGPSYFTPVLDVRVTDRDLRLLSFVVPAADADELVPDGDGNYLLPLRSQCELIIPPETAEALINGLTQQLEVLKRNKEAAKNG
ncbi:MAG: hypothetical protein KDA24_08640 [Deltaproteobacteria bacterium]|nr:hypothetical protein [Deltaproteobacteria bacterium]